MLRQFDRLRGDTPYDAILLVTDEGSYELSADAGEAPDLQVPLAWMVHLGSLPAAYDDNTLSLIQDSGGGVTTQLPRVLQRMATEQRLGDRVVSVTDGYVWSLEKASETPPAEAPAKTAEASQKDEGFFAIAARQLILGLSRQMDSTQLENLDAIHAIAKTYELISPYSSMVVLVNDEQRQMLQEAEASSDRFARAVEDGNEDLQQPNNPFQTNSASSEASVPEPSAIVGLLGIGMLFLGRRVQQKLQKT